MQVVQQRVVAASSARASPRASAPTSPHVLIKRLLRPDEIPRSPSRRRRRSSSSNATASALRSNVRERSVEPRPPSRQRHASAPSRPGPRTMQAHSSPRSPSAASASPSTARLRRTIRRRDDAGGLPRRSGFVQPAVDVLAAQPRPLPRVARRPQRARTDRATHCLRMHAGDLGRLRNRQQRRLSRPRAAPPGVRRPDPPAGRSSPVPSSSSARASNVTVARAEITSRRRVAQPSCRLILERELPRAIPRLDDLAPPKQDLAIGPPPARKPAGTVARSTSALATRAASRPEQPSDTAPCAIDDSPVAPGSRLLLLPCCASPRPGPTPRGRLVSVPGPAPRRSRPARRPLASGNRCL